MLDLHIDFSMADMSKKNHNAGGRTTQVKVMEYYLRDKPKVSNKNPLKNLPYNHVALLLMHPCLSSIMSVCYKNK